MAEVWSLFGAAWNDFSRTWLKLIAADTVYKLAAFVLLTPLVGVALRSFVVLSGDTVLADQDILLFFLSPIGWVALVVVVAAGLGIVALQQACLMIVGFGAVRDQEVRVLDALWLAARHLGSILQLTGRLVLRVLLLAAPFLAAAAGVFWWLLTEFDINFYLTERPPQFRIAVALIGVILIGLATVLVPRLLSWAYALPIHLFEEPRAARAIAASEERTSGHKRTVSLVLAGWAIASVLSASLALGVVGALGRFIIPSARGSIPLLVFAMGGIVLLWSAVNFVTTWFQTASFALLVIRLYNDLGSSGAAKVPDASDRQLAGPKWRLSLKVLVVGLSAAAVLAALVGYVLLDGVRTQDDVVVIAHRGAAGRAPENTLASIRAALEDGADFVEIDVQETADGEVVVLHDSDFMRIAGDPRRIWDLTFDEARALDIGSWYSPQFSSERIPTLAEVLELAKGKAHVDIELKYYGHEQRLEERVVDIVEAAGMTETVVVMSLKLGGIRKVRGLRADWTIGLLAATAVGDLNRVDADFLAVHAGMATSRFINRTHDAGKDIYVWTVNDPIHMSTMVSRGVDGLITDEPALARQVLAARAGLSSWERLLVEVAFWLGVDPREPPPEEDLG